MLEHLDVLEDHPNFYVREQEDISTDPDRKIQKCWVYLIKKFRHELLQQPHLECYESKGPHGLQYCESDKDESTLDDIN
ncbi:hypothetical protein B566_EDAN012510 [Ephemera danica]|nr:hypothetical protein B566_EDAN012510 [Ephemera danica]